MHNNKKTAFEVYRAVAVSMVVLGHFSSSAKDLPLIVKKLCFSIASYGVPLFFIISGFLLTASFVSILKKQQHHIRYSVNTFLVKRLLRIYPAYLVSLVILSIYHDSQGFDFLVHFFNIHNLFNGYSRSINGVYWTLAVEFQWYLVAPLFILLFTKNNTKVQVVLLFMFVLLSISIRLILFNNYLNDSISQDELSWLAQSQLYVYLFNFLIGVFLYQYRNIRIHIPLFVVLLLIVTLFLIGYIESDLLTDIINRQQQAVGYKLLLTYVSTFILGLIVFAFLHIEINKIYFRLISFISLISYSLYIYHFPVVQYMERFNLDWYIFLPVYLLSSIFIAAISYYLIEAPFLKLSSKLGR